MTAACAARTILSERLGRSMLGYATTPGMVQLLSFYAALLLLLHGHTRAQQPVSTYYSVTLPPDEKLVAITFDDGPHQHLTPRLLDILKAKNAKATFYVMGVKTALPHAGAILNRCLLEGHEIGNHVWDHPVLAKLPREQVSTQLQRTSQAIAALTKRTPLTMRPPYGNTNAKLNDWMYKTHDVKVIMWSLDTNDWKHPAPEELVKKALKKVKNGDILLMHDIHAGTIRAIPDLVDGLHKLGFKLVTVSDMIERGSIAKGAATATNTAVAATAATTTAVAAAAAASAATAAAAAAPAPPPAATTTTSIAATTTAFPIGTIRAKSADTAVGGETVSKLEAGLAVASAASGKASTVDGAGGTGAAMEHTTAVKGMVIISADSPPPQGAKA